ncbi:DUF3299 domain-containing protein [Sphingomonas bacterium]|uniref:DUF3299 domain-containing protein n=1 Tax=Sphingomonas bacterium TaxID=1895847 RepID=UPI0015771330|nr:DUF3299 domain-containing protein [Sphingomonas bacterium]
MRRTPILAALAATALPLLPVVAQVQEAGERSAQARLPQGRSQLWSTLRATKISEDDARGVFRANHPPAVKALVGQTLTLPGFIMPLDAAAKGNHFLLSKYTPVCAFCPPGEPNEVVEIRTARPIAYSAKLVSVTGKFALENNGDNGLFFQMTNALVK